MVDKEQDRGEGSSKTGTPMEGVFHSHLDERVRPYIDLIDSLRLIGVGEDISLPSIAVIGDQSSGKSSVLEALSGVALPRGSGIVTRCPLQLKLRKNKSEVQWQAVLSYKEESIKLEDPSQVEIYVCKAQNELAGDGVGICDDLITLEIKSTSVCDLTLIDLPGIARVPVKGQPDDIGEQIKNLIRRFIEKRETINLVVVPCNVDIATTEALKMAQEVDPDGKRTLAILTKPDLVDKGTEKTILKIVRNQVVPLSKGYIIVKCRGQKQIEDKISLEQAIQEERDFFKKHNFFSCLLQEEKATVNCLATKLTQDLVDHIKKSLPLLSEEIKRQLRSSREELNLYHKASPPLESQNLKAFFIGILIKFNDKINHMASGVAGDEGNLFVQLHSEFKKWKEHLVNTKSPFHGVVQAVVKDYDLKYRGRELPGFSDYNVFETEVQKLVIQLKQPAIDRLRVIREIIQNQFLEVSRACFPIYPYLQSFAMNKIEDIQSKQETKVEQRIMEQFEMEQLVYSQDDIYFKTLNEILSSSEGASEDRCPGLESRNKYPEMLKAYYEIVVQRLADQVPMLIRYFMLKESAHLLCSEMLGLIEGADIADVLREDSDISRRCAITEARIERLTIAQKKLSSFV
ncbi:interferon-induced GTP-binding protein Mx3-like [Colossoma macropomum]|uniref:interferon-induced GTP-binding protein Mx3-like n=1 Tax=Colossoma macropomum TaxID=42526 RepID=UPI0018647EA2|nr:interferon-induced GTP-binding protein Mx3-like [Colossoma macropomum]